MKITTPRLWLRPADVDLVDSTFAYAADPANAPMMVYLPFDSHEETRKALADAAHQWLKPAPAYYEFAVMKGDEHIGGITLYVLDAPATLELGWIIAKAHWGHGYAAEAARGVMDYAQRTWGVHHFIALCDSENAASRRTMEKLGMTFVKAIPGRKNRSSPNEERLEWMYEIKREG
ncbi:MAG: GNAT family N-acetyltransferase [Clostridia bacterium]|nr:GNAT family N-acetyltransferase [Clostridia bacterium]